ncbi:MAG: hypothetical protein HY035_10155 [Nitrospirae bacterium]|nr:hypothetical protein [Nitrospirota bacterium]MBI3378741.1 hypothetical protein [Nitrospirota bacterium]
MSYLCLYLAPLRPPKIRQQLQILRDKGILKFKGKGRYQIF